MSALNGLQTNAAVLAQIRRHGDSSEHGRMQQYLQRVGLAPADLHQLNAIHVSGTKGKVGRAGISSRITPRRACAQRAIG